MSLTQQRHQSPRCLPELMSEFTTSTQAEEANASSALFISLIKDYLISWVRSLLQKRRK